jgi:protein gp37
MVFVNSMSDLFHDDIPDDFIRKVFNTMAIAHKHTFQVLTKRADRMQRFMSEMRRAACTIAGDARPFSNVWLGVSVENNDALYRVDSLLKTPAAVRFISYEPALELVDFNLTHASFGQPEGGERDIIEWLIVGGESGKNARPFNLSWARDAIEQCERAAIPCFVKQLGGNLSDADLRYCAMMSGRCMHDKAGADPDEWPPEMRVREFPKLRRESFSERPQRREYRAHA